MTLTVPVAGSTAGRSASIQIAAPNVGEPIAAFGQALAQEAHSWQAEQQDREVQRGQLGMTRDLGLLRQQVEQLGDPAQMGQAWDAGVKDLRTKYMPEGTDPKVAERLDLAFTSLSDRHTLDLGERSIALRQSQAEADWLQNRSEITATAANADGTTFQALLAQGEAQIDAQIAKGIKTPAQGAQEKLALRQDVYGARADALIDADPQSFLDAAKAGQWDSLGENLAPRQRAAEQAVARNNAVAVKNAEADAKARADEIGKRLDDIATIAGEGRFAVDEAFLSDPEVQASPKYAKAAAAVALRQELPGIKVATLGELDAAIAEEQKKPLSAPFQAERLKVLQTWRDEALQQQKTAPLEWAQKVGLAVPGLPDQIDPADPKPFASALAARLSFDGALQQSYGTTAPAVFSADERAKIKSGTDPQTGTDTRLAYAKAFAAQGPGAANYVMAAASADPVFQRATRLLMQTGDQETARGILMGQQNVDAKTVVLPSEPDRLAILSDITGPSLDNQPRLKAEILAAATALYAAKPIADEVYKAPGQVSNSFEEAFRATVQQVMGGMPDPGGNMTVGGFQQVHGAATYLPPGISAKDVETTFENVRAQMAGAVARPDSFPRYGGTDLPPNDPARMRGWRAASITGKLPDFGPDASGVMQAAQLRPVFDQNGQPTDVYELTVTRNGRTVPVRQADDPNGQAFRFRLPALIEGGKK